VTAQGHPTWVPPPAAVLGYGARDEIEAILVSGLAANGESSERARDIVNKLVAGGHVDYERLLQR
jgi:hypothetical protein